MASASPEPQAPSPKPQIDVYLVPIGTDRWECYYEAIDDEDAGAGEGAEFEEPKTFLGRLYKRSSRWIPTRVARFFTGLRQRFHQQLREAENARHQAAIEEPKTFLGRMHKRSLAWIAERIAEQRLLWHLRRATTATLHIPADLPPEAGDRVMRYIMKRDADRHRNRLIPHSLLLILSGVVAVIPGPNVLGYLLTFTVVGHFLSWRGANNALHGVAWTVKQDPILTELRRAFSLETADRHRVIKEIAQRLQMPKMARFVEQMSAAGT